MHVWFIGSGPFAALCLERLASLVPLERVITALPSRAGRGLKESVTPVERCALALNLKLERTGPLSKNDTLLAAMQDPPDGIFVVDFAQLIREPYLNGPRFGCLNIHPSLLPRWRGAAPVQRALLNGDEETGVTLFRLASAMDAGPILKQAAVPVHEDDNASGLYKILSGIGSEMAAEGLKELEAGNAVLSDQDEKFVSQAPKLERSEFELDWSWPAGRIHNAVRALEASGGAFVFVGGKRLKIWRTKKMSDEASFMAGEPGQILSVEADGPVISCAEGAVCLCEVQTEGRRRASGSEWLRGQRLKIGDRLEA